MIAGGLSTRASGVKVAVEGLSQALADRGHSVHVFGFADEAWGNGDSEKWQGAPATALPAVGPARLGYAPSLRRALDTGDFDLVHLHGLWRYSSHAVERWAVRNRRPYLVSTHGMLAPDALRYSPWSKRITRVLYQDRCFRHAAAFHATCERERDEIRAYGLGQPVAIFPNGINSIPVEANPPGPGRKLVTLGRLHSVKGLDRLIGAWSIVAPDFPEWDLVIAGPDTDGTRHRLETMVAADCVLRVSFREAIFGVERDQFLADADLFALPSLTENFALTVAEALMQETPVISTKGAPWSGLKTHGCGWWIDHGIEPLAQTLRQAMAMPHEALQEMGRSGRAWMLDEFVWDAVAARTETAYRDVLATAGNATA
jgi:glycosyltransferase involved in cell wall biosynthesis